jgi:hypothetical protein
MRPYRWRLLRPLYLWYWRAREREVLDIYQGETTGSAAPDYTYGKVTGLPYDLLVITETTESPYVCCGYCSAGMACVVARSGITKTMSSAAHPIRSEGGRPHDNGSRASELRDGARRAHGVELDALAVAEIPERLRAGYSVVANLDYADLPAHLKVQGGSFGHSVCLYGWREDGDYVGFFDPLYGQDVRGAWAKWTAVKPALWGDGEHSSTVVKRPESEPEPEPECPDCPPAEAHTQSELEAIARDAASWAILLDDDAEVGVWIEWLRAPRARTSDRWDAGAWADLGEELERELGELEARDPCDAGAPAVWARGPIPSPASDALTAVLFPAAWDTSSWRAAVWQTL